MTRRLATAETAALRAEAAVAAAERQILLAIPLAQAAPVAVAKSGYLNLKKRPVSLARWAEAG